MSPHPTIYLIDGSAYIYRAYHAIRGLSNSKGFPTNAVFGFTRILLKWMETCQPEYAIMLFDAKGPTFRHEMYQAYKAHRPPMPEDLAVQIEYIKAVTRGLNIPMLEKQGFEADDLIGTLARMAQEAGFSVVMITGDKDFTQLVTQQAIIWDPMKEKTLDLERIHQEYDVEPQQMIDVLGLTGDASDNIPGVPGIGPKTAVKLIKQFGDMHTLYDHIDEITARKQRENLKTYKAQALLSRRLVTIDIHVPLDFDAVAFRLKAPDNSVLADLFKELEFRQLQEAFPKPSDLSRKTYQAVLDMESLQGLVDCLSATERFALDTETTSRHPMQAELVGLSFAVTPHEAWYIPCGHKDAEVFQLDLKDVLKCLKPVLEDGTIEKIGQNIKYDWMVLARYGIHLQGVAFDTMLASYLINPSRRAHNLDQIALDYLDHKTITYEEVVGKGNPKDGFAVVPIEKAVPYACEDADVTLLAYHKLRPQLESLGLMSLLQTVEMPLVPVLMKMEMAGIHVDQERLLELSKSLETQLVQIENEIYALAGETFNINSSRQLGSVLFEKLGLPIQKKTKKKTAYSTDMSVLTQLSEYHELPALILRHRSLAKLKSTYTDSLLQLIHPETGRIHTSFNQTVTVTGRLSSSEPNLQNIPIRSEEGRHIREAFVPRLGWRFLSADYSQIELRILAHCSNDDLLIESFVHDEDIHARTAGEVFQVLPGMITPELRRQAKAINFGIIYGMTPFRLAKDLGISQKMAKTYIEHYFARYKGVKHFIDKTIADARENRQTSTLLGRIRRLPDIGSKNAVIRQFAERAAINTPIQGSAADLIKLAMIRVDAAMMEKQLTSAMLLTVHDELVFEVPPEEMAVMRRLVKDVMEGVWKLKVPLKVNINAGDNWAEAH
jgi:DNA polymerase-1